MTVCILAMSDVLNWLAMCDISEEDLRGILRSLTCIEKETKGGGYFYQILRIFQALLSSVHDMTFDFVSSLQHRSILELSLWHHHISPARYQCQCPSSLSSHQPQSHATRLGYSAQTP